MQHFITRLPQNLTSSVRFFSILPMPGPHTAPNMAQMTPFLGLASLLISLPAACVLVLAHVLGFSSLVAATLALGTHIFVTGAMGEDALGDSADAVFGGRDQARKREILKDSRLGTFGVCAIGVILLLHFSALSTMIANFPLGAAAAIVASSVLARSLGLWQMVQLSPAFENGLAAQAGPLEMRIFAIGVGVALICALPFALYIAGGLGLIVALIVVGGLNFVLARLWGDTIGGYCGDTIGASMRISEIAILTLFSLFV